MKKRIKSYAIRSSRMSDSLKKAFKELYDKHCITFKKEKIDLSNFNNYKKVIVEIGFGMGDTTIEIAENNIDKIYLAIDIHKPGVAKIIKEIENKNIKNIKVINHDAFEVFENMLDNNSIDGIHIFFPDPWPKKRHNKRRLLKSEFIKLLSIKLKKNGYLYICTDWENYAYEIIDNLNENKNIKNKYKYFAEPQKWRPKTKYEEKGILKKHNIFELFFIKN